MSLSGQQRKEIQLALLDAFPTESSLEQMLSFELDKKLKEIAASGNLGDIIFKMIKTAEAEGWIEGLIDAAKKANPRNTKLLAIPQTFETPPQSLPISNSVVKKILILAAIPHGLRLDKEIRFIEECIRRAVKRDSYRIIFKTAVRAEDIRRAIAEEKPQIVHFCGHGLEDGSLLLEDDRGQDSTVSPQGLAALFELHKDYVDCVLLNACHSVKSAIAISKYISYAIGMNQKIQDNSAIQFSQGFYDGLGYETLENLDGFRRAFEEGLAALKMENPDSAEIPVMKTKIYLNKPHKPIDIPSLVEILAPCLPFLPPVGNQVVGGASQKRSENVWRKAIVVWSQLLQKVQEKPAALEAVMDVAKNLEDEDSQASLRKQLQKILESDAVLSAEIAKTLESSVTQPTSDNIQMSGKSEDQSTFKQIGKIQGHNVSF